MTLPLQVDSHNLQDMEKGNLVLEVWDKYRNNRDVLIGVVKLSLRTFYAVVSAGGWKALEHRLYPLVAYDEFVPIQDIRTNEVLDVGFLKVMLGLGTAA